MTSWQRCLNGGALQSPGELGCAALDALAVAWSGFWRLFRARRRRGRRHLSLIGLDCCQDADTVVGESHGVSALGSGQQCHSEFAFDAIELVDEAELARAGAFFTPRAHQAEAGIVLMNAAVAVSVGNVEVAIG